MSINPFVTALHLNIKLTMVILLANTPCSLIKYGSVKVTADMENRVCFVTNRMIFYRNKYSRHRVKHGTAPVPK